jgi:hypothetical protein
MKRKHILIATVIVFVVVVVFFMMKRKRECFENNDDPYISIVTLRKYKDALDHLLESFPNGFNKYIITYQGEDIESDYYEQKEDGHYEIYCKRNIFEYGAWPALNMLKNDGILKDDDKILMIHDTCKLGEKTLENIRQLDFNNYDIFWASDVGQCNLCVVKGKVIEEGSKLFDGMNTLDRGVGISMEWNHSHEKSLKNIKMCNHKFYEKGSEFRGSKKIYSDVERNVLYFESLDIEKYYVHVPPDGKGHPTIP